MSTESGPISPARLRLLLQLALGSGADISLANPLPVTFGALVPGVDVSDRAARLLGIVYGELAQLQQLTPADGVIPNLSLEASSFPHVYDAVAGDWNRWLQSATAGIPQVQDTGVNTNPERWLHENHWEADEVSIVAAGVGGEQALGVAVPAGVTRRVRELTIRNPRADNVVITLLIAGGATKVTIDVPAQSTRVWSSQDGREFDPAEQPAVQSSAAAAAPNNVLVSASGVQQ